MTQLAYAVPDLHGRLDLLQSAISTISGRGGGHVIFLGDYIDRGPESRGVVETLIAGPPPDQTWTVLRGNHEAFCILALSNQIDVSLWLSNGGDATLRGYTNADNTDLDPAGSATLAAHGRWMGRLQLYLETDHHVFVHAGLNPRVRRMADQDSEVLQWERPKPPDLDYDFWGKHVVHGHTPQKREPMCLRGRTNLDVGAYARGVLYVGVFDLAAPGGPRDILEVRPAIGYSVPARRPLGPTL